MTELLHMNNCYIKRFDAEIVEIVDEGVILNKTAFYPLSGGVEDDRGMLIINGNKFVVIGTRWINEKVVHLLENIGALKIGEKVNGEIEWERRHHLMRLHTAAHLLESEIYKKTGALIGSSRVAREGSYLGFTLDVMDKEIITNAVTGANKLIESGAKVNFKFMKRTEVMKNPDLIKLAGKLPPEVDDLRVVKIEGIEKQACGGPHVENISEIEEIKIVKFKNKGAKNRRVYFEVI